MGELRRMARHAPAAGVTTVIFLIGCSSSKKDNDHAAAADTTVRDANTGAGYNGNQNVATDTDEDGPVLSDDPEDRPESRLPPAGENCPDDDDSSACPTCDLVADSIEEVPSRLKYLGIPAKFYTVGETEEDAGDPDIPTTVLIVDSRNEKILRTLINGDFESFYDKTRSVTKKRKLSTERVRAEFDNLRLGLVGHMWCNGDLTIDEPSYGASRSRIGFAFTNRKVSFARVRGLDGASGWSWPPGFKPLGFTALGDHEQLLEKVYEEGNGWSGGAGHGYVVLRVSPDDMIDLRKRTSSAKADFVFVLAMSCGIHEPCSVNGLDYPTLLLRDPKSKKVFYTQKGFTGD